jgi:hypothetical protein
MKSITHPYPHLSHSFTPFKGDPWRFRNVDCDKRFLSYGSGTVSNASHARPGDSGKSPQFSTERRKMNAKPNEKHSRLAFCAEPRAAEIMERKLSLSHKSRFALSPPSDRYVRRKSSEMTLGRFPIPDSRLSLYRQMARNIAATHAMIA